MPSAYFLVPGRLEQLTGGSIYDRRIVSGLRDRGWTIDVRELDDAFPRPSARTLAQVRTILSGIPEAATVVVDGLAFGAMAEIAERHARRLRFVAVVHLPLACDPSLSVEERDHRRASEQHALQFASLVVVTGLTSRSVVANYGVPQDRIAVVEPGTDPAAPSAGSDDGRVHLLCVATVNAIKGHDLLIGALHRMRDMNWHLCCAGSLTRDERTADTIRRMIIERDLQHRVDLTGELDAAALATRYDRADLFVLGTRYETYGMAVAEALARGVPVVATRTGAVPTLVGDEAGLLVPPDDEDALCSALRAAIGDEPLRARLRAGARRAAARLQPWSVSVERFSSALARVAAIG